MTKKLKLDIETLEDRIAPSLHGGGCDTLGCGGGDGPDPQPDHIIVLAQGAGGVNGAVVSFIPFGEDVTRPDVSHP